MPDARRHARATSPPAGHLLLPSLALDAPDVATQLPRTALTLLSLRRLTPPHLDATGEIRRIPPPEAATLAVDDHRRCHHRTRRPTPPLPSYSAATAVPRRHRGHFAPPPPETRLAGVPPPVFRRRIVPTGKTLDRF